MPAARRPHLEETAQGIVLDNGRVHLVVSPVLGGRLTELRLDGHPLLGPRRTGRFDQVVRVLGPTVDLQEAPVTWSVRELEDAVMLTVTVPPSTAMPCTAVRRFLLAAGQTGVHLASRFEHADPHPAVAIDQHRFVCWLDPGIFTHIDLEDDAFGAPWRAAASRLPTPEDLRRGRTVMDATTDLSGTSSTYSRRIYTKYDWAISLREHAVHGLHGRLDGRRVGAYAVLTDRSSFIGGPDRQDLTAHQTEDGPVLLIEPQATHYGSQPVVLRGEVTRSYGPHYLHLGWAEGPEQLRAEAAAQPAAHAHRDLYDRVAPSGWVPTAQRAQVHGRVTTPGGAPALVPQRTLVILSDPGVEAQDTAMGSQHWTGVDTEGRFRLDGVPPGTYRLTVREDGVWDEHIEDRLVISGDTCLAVRWPRQEPSEVLWRIGTPDGSSEEFPGGAAARRWASTAEYSALFPHGVVHEVDGQDPAWYFTQPQTDGHDGPSSPWRIVFHLERAPSAAARPRLRLSLAAWSLDTALPNPGIPSAVTVRVNDAAPLCWQFSGDDARGAVYRSAARARRFRRDLALAPGTLRAGVNTVELAVNPGGLLAVQATWDALQLELE